MMHDTQQLSGRYEVKSKFLLLKFRAWIFYGNQIDEIHFNISINGLHERKMDGILIKLWCSGEVIHILLAESGLAYGQLAKVKHKSLCGNWNVDYDKLEIMTCQW